MNIVVKSALASAALAFAYACATPVEIGDDVQEVNPNIFGDAGTLGGAAGAAGQGGASQGGTGAGAGGTSAGTGAMGGAGIAGMPVGSSGGGGLPVAGAGGSGAGGVGGTAAGSGGAGGTAGGTGGAAGTGVTGGTGGTGSSAVFDPASCDFDDVTGCDTLTCQARCPTNDGNSCLNRCVAVVDCVSEDVAANPSTPCVTADDPLCGGRDGGQARACTTVVEPAGGPNPNAPTGTQAPQPAFVARGFVECICSVPRP